jgi:hypothetical protein
MPSNINPLNPVTGSPTTASVRANFQAAHDEIGALQVTAPVSGGTNTTFWRGDGSWQVPPTSAPSADTVTRTITAAGQVLSSTINEVTTVAAGAGVTLPVAAAGAHCYVRNSGANPLLLSPASGAAINALAAGAPVTVPVDTTANLVAVAATQWFTVP